MTADRWGTAVAVIVLVGGAFVGRAQQPDGAGG